MKYIEADKLIAEIERQIRLEDLQFAALGGGGQTFCINTLEWVLERIDSLQQEQQEVELDKYIEREIEHLGMSLSEASYKTFSASEIERLIRKSYKLGLNARNEG